MRNLFDQYSEAENRLTHALAVCLDEDRRLLGQFLRWVRAAAPVPPKAIRILVQRLPGDPLGDDDDGDGGKGLPDIVMHDDESWCLIVENKVMSPLRCDQLRRHRRTVERRGFEQVCTLVVAKDEVVPPPGGLVVTWAGLYEWLGLRGQRGEWPDRLRDYLRAAELRMIRENKLPEKTLTTFDGFPFSERSAYTYGEAKRLLGLALRELRKDKALRALGMDPKAPGRPAITGRGGRTVWDFLSLVDRPKRGLFTSFPHLTLAVHDDHLEVAVTVPNGVIRPVRNRLAGLGADGMTRMNEAILRRARALIARNARVRAYAMQRHYRSQRSLAINDATLMFRLETCLPRGAGRVKHQPEWLELFATLPRRSRSNMQFQYRVEFPWGTEGIDSRDALRLIVESWLALVPLLDVLRGRRPE